MIRPRIFISHIYFFLALFLVVNLSGCLKRSSDKSGDPTAGSSSFGGSFDATSSSAPGHFFGPSYAIIDPEGISNLVIYAEKTSDGEAAEKVYPEINPESNTFMFTDIKGGTYTVSIRKKDDLSGGYKFRVNVSSSYKMLFSDIQLSGTSLAANIFKIKSTTPSDKPSKIACKFNSSGFVVATATDVTASFENLVGDANIVGSTEAITEKMKELTDSSSTDIISIAKILSKGTTSLAGTAKLSDLSGANISPKSNPSFTVEYGADANFSEKTIKQGDTVYVKVITSPKIASVHLYAKVEVYDDNGILLSLATGNKAMTSTEGTYSYDTKQLATDSGLGIWGSFNKAGTVKVNLTIINKESGSADFGAVATKTNTITVESTSTKVISVSTAPTLDGEKGAEEWPSSSLIITDDTSDGTGSGTDIYKIYAAKDSTYIYLRMDLASGEEFDEDYTYAFRIGVKKQTTGSMGAMIKGDMDIRILYDSVDEEFILEVVEDADQSLADSAGAKVAVDDILECKVALADLGLGSNSVAFVGAYIFSGTSFASSSSAKDATETKLMSF